MRRSIATICLSGTLDEKLAAAARAGFDGVELFENDLINSALTPRDVRARADELGLTIDLYQPFRDFEAVADLEPNLRRAEAKLDVMEERCAPWPSAPRRAGSRSPTRRSPGGGTSTSTTTRGGSSSSPTIRRSASAST